MSEATAKPIFPPWMRRLDPLLAAEDTNPVFEAYYKLGLQRNPRDRSIRIAWRTIECTMIPILLLIPFLSSLDMWDWSLPSVAFWSGLLLIAGWFHYSHKRRPVGRNSILAAVRATPSGRHFVDLWLSGRRGSEILEAAYLEWAAEYRVLHGVMMGVGSVAWILLIIGIYPVDVYTSWLLITSSFYFATEVVLTGIEYTSPDRDWLLPCLQKWSSKVDPDFSGKLFDTPSDRSIPYWTMAFTCIAVMAVLGWKQFLLGMACAWIAAGLKLRWNRRRLPCAESALRQRLFAAGDAAFEEFMQREAEKQAP